MCKKGMLQQFKVPQGGDHAVLVHRAGGIVGLGILPKSLAEPMATPIPAWRSMVRSFSPSPKGHGLLRGKAEVGEHGVHALVLAPGGGDDIQKGGVPPGGLQVGARSSSRCSFSFVKKVMA